MGLNFGSSKAKSSRDLTPVVARAARQASLIGWNAMADEYTPQIAKEFGTMRTAFREVGLEIINSQRGSTNIRFSINEIYSRLVKKDPKSEHHLEVGPTGKSFYIRPTTPNTAPIKSGVFIPILIKHTQEQFAAQLRLHGIKLRRRR